MKRRNVVAGLLAGAGFAVTSGSLWQRATEMPMGDFAEEGLSSFSATLPFDPIQDSESGRRVVVSADVSANVMQAATATANTHTATTTANTSASADNLADKVRNFESEFADDIYLPPVERPLLISTLLRMERTQRFCGHGNFNLLGFDEMIKLSKNYSAIGAFLPEELAFIEKVFAVNAAEYGFLGEKVTSDLTATIKLADTIKVPGSGHYLFKSHSLTHYDKLQKDVGQSIILTSGIRSNVKQMHLFLAKASQSNFNMSKASRSLAPPGHSYHGIGDFDVGKIGFGESNFTDSFAETDEFKRMLDLGYIDLRYTVDNRIGVRFEPWHIKVV